MSSPPPLAYACAANTSRWGSKINRCSAALTISIILVSWTLTYILWKLDYPVPSVIITMPVLYLNVQEFTISFEPCFSKWDFRSRLQKRTNIILIQLAQWQRTNFMYALLYTLKWDRFLAKGSTDYVLVTEGQFTSEVWMSLVGIIH